MIQFYCLSVLLDIVGGYALCHDAFALRGTSFDGVRAFLRDRTTRIVIGILAAVTGAFKLLAVVHGDIPVIGDLFPAVAGLAVGASLLLDSGAGSAKAETPAEGEAPAAPRARGRLELLLLERKGIVGVVGIVAGIVHFLFPMVVFL